MGRSLHQGVVPAPYVPEGTTVPAALGVHLTSDVPLLEPQVATWLALKSASTESASSLDSHRRHASAFLADAAALVGVPVAELTCAALSPAVVAGAVARYRTAPDQRFADPDDAPAQRSPASVARRCATIRSILSHLVDEELVRPRVLAAVPRVRVAAHAPRVLTLAEAQSVLEAAAQSRFASRDTLVVSLALTMGLSLKEVAGLRLDAVEGDTVRVTGKRGAVRVVALSPTAKQALESYLPERAALLARRELTSRALVVSVRERQGSSRPTLDTTYPGVGRILERVLEAAGLSAAGWRSHALRATFASLALSSGSHTVHEVQAALGHASLAPIRDYVGVDPAALGAAASRHPLAG